MNFAFFRNLLLAGILTTAGTAAQSPALYLSSQSTTAGIRYGYRNADSQLVLPYRYEAAKAFSEGYAPVRQAGIWCLIRPDGQTAVSLPGYTDVGEVHGSLAAVSDARLKWGYVDPAGTLRIPLIYEAASDFNLYNVGTARVLQPGMQFANIGNPLLETTIAAGQRRTRTDPALSGTARLQEAMTAYRRKDYYAAMPPTIAAVATGNPGAMSLLGTMYHLGQGCAKDDSAAFSWWQKAAHRADPYGLLNAGIASENGTGTRVNYARALFYYQHAADLGDATAMKNIGLLYLTGHGVERNDWIAVSWFEKAAKGGNLYAAYAFGFAALYGVGHQQDNTAARRWLGVAAAARYRDAESLLYQLDHPVEHGRYNKDFMNDPTLVDKDAAANQKPAGRSRPILRPEDLHFPQPSYREQLQEQSNREYDRGISEQMQREERFNRNFRR